MNCSLAGEETGAPVRPRQTIIHDLADELLELVLLRISSPFNLIRAAATCRLWRHLITTPTFLRRFRSLHSRHISIQLFSKKTKGAYINENQSKVSMEKTTQTTIGYLTDDLLDSLDLVFLRIRSPACLLRAAATCKPWRRVIAGAAFLRRFRSLHAPPLLGHYHVRGSRTFFVPSVGPPPESKAAIDLLTSAPNYKGSHLNLADCRVAAFSPSPSPATSIALSCAIHGQGSTETCVSLTHGQNTPGTSSASSC
ncbi:hypothetical protein EJB05_50637, partial [Eragrostis curvula]